MAQSGSSCQGVDEGSRELDEGTVLARKAHECPVPRPGGILGKVLGFRREGWDEVTERTGVRGDGDG